MTTDLRTHMRRSQAYQLSKAAEVPQISGIVWLWFVLVLTDLKVTVLTTLMCVLLLLTTHCALFILDLASSSLPESLCCLTLWLSLLYSCGSSSRSLKSIRDHELMWHILPLEGLKKRITRVPNKTQYSSISSLEKSESDRRKEQSKESPERNTHSWHSAIHLKRIKTLYFTDYS